MYKVVKNKKNTTKRTSQPSAAGQEEEVPAKKAKKSKKAIKRGGMKRNKKPLHGTERKEDRETKKMMRPQENGECITYDTEAMSFVKVFRDGILLKGSFLMVESNGLKVSEALRLSTEPPAGRISKC